MSEGLSFDLALSHPDFDLHMQADLPGHGVTALVGPSGSGKTTLLQALAGLESARGHVTLNGRALHPLPPHRRGVAVVFQNTRLFGHLDVRGNIDFGAARRGTDPALVDKIVGALDLHPLLGRAVSRLSGGETRRVALARALAASPDLLLLDEPLSGLDPVARADILPYLARAIRAADCPALFVTHDVEESLILADRRLSVSGGRILGDLPSPPLLPLAVHATDPDCLWLGDRKIRPAHAIHAKERWALVLDPARVVIIPGDAQPLDAISIPAIAQQVDERRLILQTAGHLIDWPIAPGTTPAPKVGQIFQILIKVPLFRFLGASCDPAR